MSFNILTESGNALLTESGNNLVTQYETPPPVNVCDPNTLLANAGCFSCLPSGFFLPLKLVLWSQILGTKGVTVPDVPTLLARAACFACLSPGQLQMIKLVLLCNILGGTDLFVGSSDSPLTSSGQDIVITA